MSTSSTLVRLARRVLDPVAPYSFNRMGFELNQRGFDADDLPLDVGGRIALVTGASSGIGLATTGELLRRGFDVWMLCRDRGRGDAARDALVRERGAARLHLAIVDLASLASIRTFAESFPGERVDVLVHNAGVLPDQKELTTDGIERTFATSVVGPFALTTLLLPRLSRSDDARVVFVASGGLYAQRLDLSLLDAAPAAFDGVRAYANAKRAQVILTHVLAERFAGRAPITFASMHPGWADTPGVRTSLPRFHAAMKGWLRSAEQGADTVVWLAASAPPRGTPGQFWFDRRVAMEYPIPWTHEGAGAREELFARCEALSGVPVPAAAP
jgi:NAD(P)-dependent dehydrogenase (short-subunit alcohol dehydrogenase family)